MRYDFKEIGQEVVIHEPVAIIAPERMTLKNHILISEFVYLAGGTGLFVGNHIHIAAHSCISGGGTCVLEDFSGLSAGVRLITGSAYINGEGLTNPTLPRAFQSVYRSFVHVKKHALLSTNVIVHPGITIGEGAVVGSGSVVTRDVEPWTINIGNPARPVRDRNKDRILELESQVYRTHSLSPSDFSGVVLGTYATEDERRGSADR